MIIRYTLIFILITGICNAQEKFRNFHTSVNNADKKEGIALILANDNYTNIGKLEFAEDDGKHMINALKEVDYDIEIGLNLNKEEMLEVINSFASKLSKYKNAVVYYSGHGVELEDKNYILPTDVKGTDAFSFKNSAIDLSTLFFAIDNPKIPKVIILDACRESPVQFKAKKRLVKGGGLAEVEARTNSFIVFSTAPNTSISDDNDFTEILSSNIENGGCINEVVRKTRKTIIKEDPNQLIYEDGTLLDDICFGDIVNPVSLDDIDNDGIANYADQCPNKKGPIENFGCPYGNNIENNTYSHYKKNNKVGIIDAYGDIVIEPQYDFIAVFKEDGIASVLNEGKWGYINKEGEIISPIKYDYVSEFNHGRGIIIMDGQSKLINKEGKIIDIEDDYDSIQIDSKESVIITSKNNLYGLTDLNGKSILKPKYENNLVFNDGLAKARLNSKNLYVNKNGEIKLVNNYDYSSNFINGKALIVLNNQYGFIKRSGEVYFWSNKHWAVDEYDCSFNDYYIFYRRKSDEYPAKILFTLSPDDDFSKKEKYYKTLSFLNDRSVLIENSKGTLQLYKEHLGQENISLQTGRKPLLIEDKSKFLISSETQKLLYNSKGVKVLDLDKRLKKYGFDSIDKIDEIERFRGVLYIKSGHDYIYLDSYYRPFKKVTYSAFDDNKKIFQHPYFTTQKGVPLYYNEETELYGVYSKKKFKKLSPTIIEKIVGKKANINSVYLDENGFYGLIYQGINGSLNVSDPIFDYFSSYSDGDNYLEISRKYFKKSEYNRKIVYNSRDKCFSLKEKSSEKIELFKKHNITNINECD